MATLTLTGDILTLTDGGDSWSGQMAGGQHWIQGCFIFEDNVTGRWIYVRVDTSTTDDQPWTVNDYVLNVDMLWASLYAGGWQDQQQIEEIIELESSSEIVAEASDEGGGGPPDVFEETEVP